MTTIGTRTEASVSQLGEPTSSLPLSFTRVSKILLTTLVSFYLLLVILNNLTDYRTNFNFVQHVMMMDTTYGSTSTQWRAIHSPVMQHATYALIITWEALACALCWIGSYSMIKNLRRTGMAFNEAKAYAVSGLTCALLLWGFAFVSIGGEWFMMWQSTSWNGDESAERLFCMTGIVLLALFNRD